MNQVNHNNIKWAGILLLAGGLIFWAGAFYPPYKQWMARDIKEYLSIINSYRLNWFIIHGLFMPGIIISLFGVQLLSSSMQALAKNPVFAIMGSNAFLLGSVFWILNIAFRLTVTVWVAKDFVDSGELKDWFQVWENWSNLVFAFFMILSYFGIGCLGYAMKMTGIFPSWVSWFCIFFGFSGGVLYFTQFPLFAPPLMVYLPTIFTGAVIVRLKK